MSWANMGMGRIGQTMGKLKIMKMKAGAPRFPSPLCVIELC